MTDEKATPGLLPPSAEPIPPAGTQPGEDVWYEPPVMPQPGQSRYWVMRRGMQRNLGPDGKWVNMPNDGILFDLSQQSPEAIPYWVTKRRKPAKGNDFIDNGGSYAVSQRVLDVFNEVDPEVIVARRIVTEYADGVMDPPMHFMRVTRRIPVIDFANSRVCFAQSEGYLPYPVYYGPAQLLPELPTEYHLVVDATRPSGKLFVSDTVKRRLEALKPKLYNVRFVDPGEKYHSLFY